MLCPNCSRENPDGSQFCAYCGTSFVAQPVQPVQPVQQVQPVQMVQPQVAPTTKKGLSGGQKATIIVLLLMLVGALSLLLFFNKSTGGSSNDSKVKKDNTRTIMIYLDGSDLESKAGIATVDLMALKEDKLDLEHTNILVYTGGTKEWKNDFVKNTENAIFLFTKDGYKKVKTYDQLNMGDPNTLSEFINYAYENYPAGHYNLILDDHGAGIMGAIVDDFTNDLLSLEDFGKAMKASPFNEKNKLDTVLFRTCLNGTLEVASVFAPYAEYIVFSEEISNGSTSEPVLDFLHNVEADDDGVEFGKRYIEKYQKMMDVIDIFGINPVTYSIVDLSKVDAIVKELNSFIKTVDLKNNYSSISRLRSSLYQYGHLQTAAYDTVDLYSLAKGLSKYSSGGADKLLTAINDAVIYNNTNLDTSKGISIYFPFNGGKEIIPMFLKIYRDLEEFEEYRTFINSFYSAQSEAASFSYDLTKNKSKTVDNGKEVSFQLTEEQMKNYSYVLYTVFKKDPEHPKYHYFIYSSNDVDVSDSGLITTKMANNLIKTYDEEEKKYFYVPVFHRVNGGDTKDKVLGFAFTRDYKDADEWMITVDYYMTYKDGKPVIGTGLNARNDDERLTGTLVDFKKYDRIQIPLYQYNLFDSKGKFKPFDWEVSPTTVSLSATYEEFEFERASIEDGEYFVVFNVVDINNNHYYSDLIKVGG